MGPLVPLAGTVTANLHKVVLGNHLHNKMKYFYLDGSGRFKDDNAPEHKGSLNGLNAMKIM